MLLLHSTIGSSVFNSAPFLTYSSIMEFRKSHLDAFVKKYGIKLGFMSVFSKAAAYALQDQPVVNAVIDGQVNIFIIANIDVCSLTHTGTIIF